MNTFGCSAPKANFLDILQNASISYSMHYIHTSEEYLIFKDIWNHNKKNLVIRNKVGGGGGMGPTLF